MKITFDPQDQQDVEQVETILGLLDGSARVVTAAGTISPGQVVATAEPVPGAIGDGIADDTMALKAANGDTDVHGMLWDGELHSTPPSKKADGSWKAKKGKTEELKAAIAAHKAGQPTEPQPMAAPEPVAPVAQTTAPMPGMPGTQPAAPAMAQPQAPYDFATLSDDFNAFMQWDPMLDWQVLYAGLGITNPAELDTNETMRRRIKVFMDARRAGQDQPTAIATAQSAAV